MSISNITNRNNYDLFARSFNVRDFIAEALQATDMDITGELIANKIVNNIGFNYLSPWDPTKNYIPGDIVISNNQLFRCLVANTNVEPDPNDPAQPEFVAISSNNAILSERQYAQIHLTNGNDVKALVSAIPFQSVPACLAYLKSVNGGYAKIMSIGQNITYGNGGDILLFEYDNIVIDGGDASNSYLDNPMNKIDGRMILEGCNNFTIKNVTLTRTGNSADIFFSTACNNVIFENVTIEDKTTFSTPNLYLQGDGDGIGFGSHTFKNLYHTPAPQNFFNVIMSDNCAPNTRIIFDNSGLLTRSQLRIQTSAMVEDDWANLTLIVKNSYINTNITLHYTGMTFIFENCIISGTLASTAVSGSLTLINCSFFDPVTNAWGTINLSGTAQYKLIDCFTNPNSNTDVINIAGNVNSLNYTMGPAARFNRLLTIGPGLNTSTGTTQQAITIIPGALVSNPWSIATYNAGTGSLTFTTNGFYQLCTCFNIANTSTANEQTCLNAWFGESGSTESTALASSSTDRPFVGSAGILATYPSSRKGVPFLVNVTSTVTPYFFFIRNLSNNAYNVSILNLGVVQIR